MDRLREKEIKAPEPKRRWGPLTVLSDKALEEDSGGFGGMVG
jgi:hypothetical protein